MIKNIALVTSLFDYPVNFQPSFYKNALKDFEPKDIHIIRNNELIPINSSLYEKYYFYKIKKVYEYIQTIILGNYEYVLFMDALDTNFIKSVDGIIEKFNRLNISVITGAEKTLWPPTPYSHLYEEKRKISEFKYLNSGTYFGFTDKICSHLKSAIDRNDIIDDQGCWTAEYLLNNDIMIDQECEFFFSTHESKDRIMIQEEKYVFVNANPYIIHDNGPYGENTIKLTEYYNKKI